MLAPDERALLVDLLAPPDSGYRLERAVGTTFTMQLEALLRIPLGVLGAEWTSGIDPLRVLAAVREGSDRIDVFCQTGCLSVPPSSSPLFEFLRPMIHPVEGRAGESFHPKVWLASFVDPDTPGLPRRFRFVCGSRNVTNDRAWDAVVALEGTELTGVRDRRRVGKTNRPLAEFITSLSGRSIDPLPPERVMAIGALSEAVLAAEWDRPEALSSALDEDWLAFHWWSAERTRPKDLTAGSGRRLIVSPFLDRAGLDVAWPDGDDCDIVSRPEAFDALAGYPVDGEDAARAPKKFVIDDAVAIADEESDGPATRWSLNGLHAKIIVWEDGRTAHWLMGSANATGAGWGRNTEFMVELRGSARRMGVAQVLPRRDGDRVKGESMTFASLLRHYERTAVEQPDDLERAAFRSFTDELAVLGLRGSVEANGDATWLLRLESVGFVPECKPQHPITVSIRPLTLPAQARTVQLGAPVDLQWSDCRLSEITPFFVIEVTAGPASKPVREAWLAVVELEGDPADRLDQVIAGQFDSPDAFLRFAMMILALASGESTEAVGMLSTDARQIEWAGSVLEDGLLERIALALADGPGAIDRLGHWIERLSATQDGRERLPDGLVDLWAAVAAARAEQGQR